jgi:hypothetical protein
MQHLDEGTIHAWLDGALPAHEAAGVERHARECADCAALVADARGVIAGVARIVSALDDVPAGVVPKARPVSESRSLWRTLRVTPFRAAIAASLMVFAASLAVIRHVPRDVTTPSQVAPPASVPTAVDVNAPSPSTQQKTVNAAEKKLNRAPITVAPPAPMSETKSAAPKGAESQPDSGARDAARRLRDVVATSSVADSIGQPAAKPLGEVARRDAAKATVSAPAAANAAVVFEARRKTVGAQLRAAAAGPIMQPFRMILTSADNRPLVFPGCYQLVHDTTSLAPLPERFSLESDGDASARRNIVRALTADGRRDSVMAGVTWQAAPGFSAGVLIVRDGPIVPAFRREAAPTLREDVASSSSGQVNRIECR